jgi:hypothetical protein
MAATVFPRLAAVKAADTAAIPPPIIIMSKLLAIIKYPFFIFVYLVYHILVVITSIIVYNITV